MDDAQSLVEVAKIYSASDDNISLLSKKLLAGEIVAVPTETVYGLAANAYDSAACARIFEAKQRPAFDPLIVHLPLNFPLDELAETNAAAQQLIDAFWPGPLTIVLPKKPIIPGIVTSGLDSVAVRMPRHPVFQRLLTACRLPLAAPSANPFGYVSPTTAQHVTESLGDRISYILDGGPCEIGLESTIVDLRNPKSPLLLRPGAISREDIAEVLQRSVADPAESGTSTEVMPGQLKRHYSPRTTCLLCDALEVKDAVQAPNSAYLFFRKPPHVPQPTPKNLFWLTETGNDLEAAHNLFDTLRRIDCGKYTTLFAEKAPPHGLGLAINDRLRRAAADSD